MGYPRIRLFFILTIFLPLALVACSSVPTPAPKTTPVLFITRSSCEVLRVTLASGAYSPAFGGATGVFVPSQGFSLAIPRQQLECRFNGVFKPF